MRRTRVCERDTERVKRQCNDNHELLRKQRKQDTLGCGDHRGVVM